MASPPPTVFVPALTGIRGIAASWVVLFHLYLSLGFLFGWPERDAVPVIRQGYIGVDLFFVLSGFVLSLRYADSLRRFDWKDYRSFLAGRIFRVFPLHWAVLAAILLLRLIVPEQFWGPGPFTERSFVAAVLLVQGWTFMPQAWNPPAWSLSAELAAYVGYPVIALLLARVAGARLSIALAVGSLVLLTLAMIRERPVTLDHAELGGLIRCACGFTAGALAWNALRHARAWFTPKATGLTLGALALFALSLSAPILQLLAPFAILALVLSCGIPAPINERLFGNRPAMFLGNISFSLYLIHQPLIFLFDGLGRRAALVAQPLPLRVLAAVVLVLTILGVATATWRWIELPGQALRKKLRLTARRSRGATAPDEPLAVPPPPR